MAALLAGTGLAWAQSPALSAPPAPSGSLPPPPAAPVQMTSAQAPAPSALAPPPRATALPGGPPVTTPPAPTNLGVHELAPMTHSYLGEDPCPGCAEGLCADGPNDPPYRIWGTAEYLLWRIKDTGVPAINSSFGSGFLFIPVVNTFVGLGAGSTTIAQQVTLPASFSSSSGQGGNGTVKFGDQPGLRFTLGYWLDSDESFGVDASYFRLWRRTNNFSSSSVNPNQGLATGYSDQQVVIVGSPLFGATEEPTQVALSAPVFVSANSQVNILGNISTETWGMEYNARCRVCTFGCLRIDAIGGFRYLDVDERLNVSQNLSLTPAPIPPAPPVTGLPPGVTATQLNNGVLLPATSSFQGVVTDFIDTHNRFYGAQVGFTYDWRVVNRVFITGFTKIALGDMRQTFSLRGFTQQLVPGTIPGAPGIVTTPGGSLVNPLDNNTTRHYDRVALVPHLNVNLAYELTPNVRVHVGYDWLYMSALARPIQQLTAAPNTTAVALGTGSGSLIGASPQTVQVFTPAFKASTDHAWMYGINLGLDIRY